MASPNPHSRPNLPSLNSLPNGKDHLSQHHHHLNTEKSLILLQDGPLSKRGRGRRPFYFPPSHNNIRLNISSTTVPIIILTYVMYSLLSRSQVQICAESVNGPSSLSYNGPLPSTLTGDPYRNNVIGEESGGDRGGGSPKTSTKSGAVTGGAEMVGLGELPSSGKDLGQRDEMRKDQGGEGSLPVLLASDSDSPPATNKDGGDGRKKDKEESLYDLIEDADIIADGLNETTMQLLFGDCLSEFEDLASSSSSMFSPTSSDSSTQQVAVPTDFDISSGSSDVSASSPTGQPPQLSPQNMKGGDPRRNFPFSPPELQQETFDGVRIPYPIPIAALAPPSPLSYVMVQPNDVLPEVIGYRQTITEDEKVTEFKAEVETIKVAARVPNRRKPKTTSKSGTGSVRSTVSSSTSSSDVVVRKIVRRVTETTTIKSTRSSQQKELSSDQQIHGEEEPTPSSSGSTSTQKAPPVSETLPLNSIDSYLEHNGMIENTNAVLDNRNLKLPPFHEIKKRRLPRSVFKEHKDKAGLTTFIVEGDEALISSSLDGIDIGSLDSPPVKRTKRRRADTDQGQSSQDVSDTNLQGQHQENSTEDKQEEANSPVASQPALPETLLQKYLENGASARHQVPQKALSEETTPIARQPSASLGDQVPSEVSPAVTQQIHVPNLQLQTYQANQIHSQIQDNSRVFKVPNPIIIGRQKLRAAAANSARMLKRQAPMFRVQQQLQQMSSQATQQQQWPPQMVQQQMTYSNPNQISLPYGSPSASVPNLHIPALETGQNPGPQWQSQLTSPYSPGSIVQTSNNLPNLPSYNQYQSQVLQQRPMYYQDPRHPQLQRQPSGQSLRQYVSHGAPRPPTSPLLALPFPESGFQQQISLNGQYFPQSQLQQESSQQNSPSHSSSGTPLPPASPLPRLLSPESGPLQQKGPINGQYSHHQSQSLVQMPMPSSSPIHYLPQAQLQQLSLEQRAPQYSSGGPAMQSPPCPVPGLPSPGGSLEQQPPYGVSNNQMKNTQVPTGTRPLTNQYQQGQPHWNQDKTSMGFENGNFLTPQTRYNIALQLQRMHAQQQARQLLEHQQAQWNSQISEGILPSQQYSPSRVPNTPAPENYYRQQQYYAPGLQQQHLSQTGRLPIYPSPPYDSAQGQSGQITSGPFQAPMQGQNVFGTSGSIPDRRTSMPFQYPYSPEIISGGEAALYRSRLGRPQPQQYPIANRAISSAGMESNGNEREITVPIFQTDGHLRHGTANESNARRKEVIPPKINYGRDAPSAQKMDVHPQSSPALAYVPETGRPLGNLNASGSGTNSHHPGKHLHHSSGHTPFYSQSEVDAHHSRVTGHHQTSQDLEFENDGRILNWYLKKANEEVQALHHRPASVTPRAPSVQPGNLNGQHQNARPASAAGNYVTENSHTDHSANATKTSD